MPNTREKLIELLQDCVDENVETDDPYVGFEVKYGSIADRLIANGVTVVDKFATTEQQWISVKDRLPEIPEGWAESPEPVLYMMKNTKTIYAGYYGEGGVWRDKYFRKYADSRNGVDADDVLCWMYQHDLPQPPKGE